jgi:TPP-dependent pyruvate/acetoin dehydrogenase alpha subunit
MAAVMKLPFILIIENNQFAYSTPAAKQHAADRLSDRGVGYGIPGVTVDGTDVLAVYEACRTAVERGRRGEGPTLIESVSMRMHGHSASDDASYVPRALLDEWKAKDPLERYARVLTEEGILDGARAADIEGRIDREIEEAITAAMTDPNPAPEDAAEGVFAP